MVTKNYVNKLELVQANISSQGFNDLTKIIESSRYLTDCNISYNDLRPTQTVFASFYRSIARNTRLQNLNLSWNNLITIQGQAEQVISRQKKLVADSVSHLIEHSKSLTHLNLTNCNLPEDVLRTIASACC